MSNFFPVGKTLRLTQEHHLWGLRVSASHSSSPSLWPLGPSVSAHNVRMLQNFTLSLAVATKMTVEKALKLVLECKYYFYSNQLSKFWWNFLTNVHACARKLQFWLHFFIYIPCLAFMKCNTPISIDKSWRI